MVLVFVIDHLCRVSIHENRVYEVTETLHHSFLRFLCRHTRFVREICWSSQHLVHVLGATMHIHTNCFHEWFVVQKLLLLGFVLSSCLELVADPVIFGPDLKALALLFLPIGPLRFVLLDNMGQSLAEVTLPKRRQSLSFRLWLRVRG